MKFFFLLIAIITTSTLFSQVNAESEKTFTNGDPIALKFIKATITPPAGYLFMENYSSFLNQSNQTSISVVRDDKMPYQAFIDNMLKKDYTVGNAKLLSHEKLEKGYLFTFLFTINNAPVERIIYVTGNEKFTIWTSANYKQVEKEKHFETLKNCLTSIKY
jgi:hypothetical protein